MVEAATKVVEMFEAKAASGEMTEAAAQEAAAEVIRAIRYDGTDYVLVIREDGVNVIHPTVKALEGKQIIDNKDPDGVYYTRGIIEHAKQGGGFTYYLWPKTPGDPKTPMVRKVSYSKFTTPWKWAVTSGVLLDGVEARAWESTLRTIGMIAVLALVTFALAFWLGRRITRPVVGLTAATNRLAEGNLAVEIPALERQDEIGVMAQAVAVLKDKLAEAARLRADQASHRAAAEQERQAAMRRLADGFEASVKRVVEGMAHAAGELRHLADGMRGSATTADGQTTSAAAAAEQTSANVATVAAATEELSASIHEIGRQVAQSTEIAAGAVAEADRTNAAMAELTESAKRIGDIVALISDVAGQTNLLALNATIEAARAGDAGKGFAVVASEVKGLASQTGRATDEIRAKVAEIQAMTEAAVTAIRAIGETVGQMNEVTTAVAAAVEEQGAATREISGNVQQAAEGTAQVSDNVAAAQRAVAATGSVAGKVLEAAGELSGEAERLRREIESFLDGVRRNATAEAA